MAAGIWHQAEGGCKRTARQAGRPIGHWRVQRPQCRPAAGSQQHDQKLISQLQSASAAHPQQAYRRVTSLSAPSTSGSRHRAIGIHSKCPAASSTCGLTAE